MSSLQQWVSPVKQAWLDRFAPWVLVGVTLLMLLPGTDMAPLIDRDEPRFAQATREMMQRGEWIVPYFNEEYRFDKPVLIYWMMRPFYRLMGVNELSARLPSVLSALLVVLALYHAGRRWFSPAVGFMAGFGFATCVQILMHGRSAVADMPMIAAVLLAHYAGLELIRNEDKRFPWPKFLLLYGSLGAGFLAKGPVALAAPLLTFLLYRFAFWRKPTPWRRLRLGWGVPLTLLIVASWGLPALWKSKGLFWSQGMTTHVWERGFEAFQGHGAFFLYYLVVALLSLFPWVAFAGDGFVAVRRNWNETNAFLLSWIVGTYALFTIYVTKLPHYVMPAFPALFLFFGQAADSRFVPTRFGRIWFWTPIVLFAVLGLAVSTVPFLFDFSPAYAGLRVALTGGAAIALGLCALAVCWRAARMRLAIWCLGAVVIGLLGLGFGLRQVVPAIALRDLLSGMPPGTRFVFSTYVAEPSFVFYTNRRWEHMSGADELNAYLREPGPRVLVIAEREVKLDKYLASLAGRLIGRDVPLKIRDNSETLDALRTDGYRSLTVEGANIARTSGVRVRVFYRMQ